MAKRTEPDELFPQGFLLDMDEAHTVLHGPHKVLGGHHPASRAAQFAVEAFDYVGGLNELWPTAARTC